MVFKVPSGIIYATDASRAPPLRRNFQEPQLIAPRALNQPGGSCLPLPPESGHCGDQTQPAPELTSSLAWIFGSPCITRGPQGPWAQARIRYLH